MVWGKSSAVNGHERSRKRHPRCNDRAVRPISARLSLEWVDNDGEQIEENYAIEQQIYLAEQIFDGLVEVEEHGEELQLQLRINKVAARRHEMEHSVEGVVEREEDG